ncbi:hypothetical protein [Pseudomonas sp. PvP001]|uniref:hypothetical protein n=1 Tax=Pseudomonas sp. PvP001 TaxID=3158559 RepID=UPI00339254EE
MQHRGVLGSQCLMGSLIVTELQHPAALWVFDPKVQVLLATQAVQLALQAVVLEQQCLRLFDTHHGVGKTGTLHERVERHEQNLDGLIYPYCSGSPRDISTVGKVVWRDAIAQAGGY